MFICLFVVVVVLSVFVVVVVLLLFFAGWGLGGVGRGKPIGFYTLPCRPVEHKALARSGLALFTCTVYEDLINMRT